MIAIVWENTRRVLLLLAIVLTVSTVWSQNNGNKPFNKYVHFENDFSIGYQVGVNKTRYELEQGSALPDALPGLIHELNLTYTFRLNKGFDFSLKGGYGFYAFAFGFGDENDPNSPNFMGYFQRNQYSNFVSISPVLTYNRWLKPKWLVSGSVGGGLRIHANDQAYVGGQFAPNWWAFSYNYGSRRKPVVFAEIGVGRLLKNMDIVDFSVGYNFGIGETFTGVYELNLGGSISRGFMYNSGNFLSAGIKYTFTRARKWTFIETNFQEEGSSFQQAKRRYKRERRFIDSRSIFMGISGGGSYLFSKASPDPFIKSSYHLGGLGRLSAQVGLKSNRFVEFGISTGEYPTGVKVGGAFFNVDASSGFLQVMELSGGYGWRIINKKGFNWVDLSGGLQLGMHNISNDDLTFWNQYNTTSYDGIPGNGIIMEVNKTDKIMSNFFPLIYGKASRNFRITNALYFSASAQYNIGFYPITKRSLTYEVNTSPPTQGNVEVKLNGTGLQFLFGLQYKIVRNVKH